MDNDAMIMIMDYKDYQVAYYSRVVSFIHKRYPFQSTWSLFLCDRERRDLSWLLSSMVLRRRRSRLDAAIYLWRVSYPPSKSRIKRRRQQLKWCLFCRWYLVKVRPAMLGSLSKTLCSSNLTNNSQFLEYTLETEYSYHPMSCVKVFVCLLQYR